MWNTLSILKHGLNLEYTFFNDYASMDSMSMGWTPVSNNMTWYDMMLRI